MAQARTSAKHLAIDKANTQMVAAVAIAAFITVFSLIAAHQLSAQNAYVGKVVKIQTTAHKQLQTDIQQANNLVSSYKQFVATSPNVLGAPVTNTNDFSNDNATIVLDALPYSYDFPALTASLEKILADRHLHVQSLTGTDEELTQGSAAASPTPVPVSMPFSFTIGNANYSEIQSLIATLQQSIRPIQIDSISLSGNADSMQVQVDAHTYYQPEKDLQITKETIQ
ncbi:MAG TPA: hypothetical protein VG992_01235 [Candidatus Saccharimonadales bacterium]|nr:hypothetical protein [Candidatus Saccharimonadales bacterium]